MELKLEDLIEGEIYYHSNWITKYIGYKRNMIMKGGSIDTTHNHFYPDKGGNYWGSITTFLKNVRIATCEEKAWLNACIEANKFIPFSEIKEEPIDIISKLEIW